MAVAPLHPLHTLLGNYKRSTNVLKRTLELVNPKKEEQNGEFDRKLPHEFW